jgi:hypothetical protein
MVAIAAATIINSQPQNEDYLKNHYTSLPSAIVKMNNKHSRKSYPQSKNNRIGM